MLNETKIALFLRPIPTPKIYVLNNPAVIPVYHYLTIYIIRFKKMKYFSVNQFETKVFFEIR